MDTIKETLVTQLTDLHALVNYGCSALDEQIAELERIGPTDALDEVRQVRASLENHEVVLQARIKALGRSATAPIKDAAAVVAGVARGIIQSLRSSEALKAVRDDSTFINHLAVSYLILDTTAGAVGDRQTVAIAEAGYRDCARILIEIDRLLPGLVLEQLQLDGIPVKSDVTPEVRRAVKEAWSLAEGAATIH